ncbi:MAG TPA: hypothetical protein VFB45_15285 [Pseudolabrys sp.]|nr:hypothetical protein [Pseudolabrys sp.]
MKLSRTWAMPSPETFSIKPIRELIERYLSDGVWIDPFCRNSVFKGACAYTNDLNPKFAGTHNMDALDFLKSLPADSVDGILFDPPFSPRQVVEAYQGFGPADTTRRFYSSRKREAARVLKMGGIAIVCGWNSLGLGAKNGMELEEVLMVNHGDQNDTIVTVGRKVAPKLDFAAPAQLPELLTP